MSAAWGLTSTTCYHASVKMLDVFPISASLPSKAHIGNADMIQPGLITLQPNLDFMDSCDPLQGSRKAPPIAAVVLHKLIVYTLQ